MRAAHRPDLWDRQDRKGLKNEIQASQIAGRCGRQGGTIPLFVSPQGHSACNKIYVQELDPSPVGTLRVQSSLQEEEASGSPWRPGQAEATCVRS